MRGHACAMPLSKYERVAVLATRVRQLDAGARTCVDWTPGESTYDIALRELEQGKMPIRVKGPARARPAGLMDS